MAKFWTCLVFYDSDFKCGDKNTVPVTWNLLKRKSTLQKNITLQIAVMLKKYPVEQEKTLLRISKNGIWERETCHSNAIFFVTIEPPFWKCSPHCSATPILFVLFMSQGSINVFGISIPWNFQFYSRNFIEIRIYIFVHFLFKMGFQNALFEILLNMYL